MGAFLLYHSLAGGTGSGLGSYVTELLRDNVPEVARYNVAVWPFASGEVCSAVNGTLRRCFLYLCVSVGARTGKCPVV